MPNQLAASASSPVPQQLNQPTTVAGAFANGDRKASDIGNYKNTGINGYENNGVAPLSHTAEAAQKANQAAYETQQKALNAPSQTPGVGNNQNPIHSVGQVVAPPLSMSGKTPQVTNTGQAQQPVQVPQTGQLNQPKNTLAPAQSQNGDLLRNDGTSNGAIEGGSTTNGQAPNQPILQQIPGEKERVAALDAQAKTEFDAAKNKTMPAGMGAQNMPVGQTNPNLSLIHI